MILSGIVRKQETMTGMESFCESVGCLFKMMTDVISLFMEFQIGAVGLLRNRSRATKELWAWMDIHKEVISGFPFQIYRGR